MARKGLECVAGRWDIEMDAVISAVVREKAVVVKVNFNIVPEVQESSTQYNPQSLVMP